MIAYAVCSVAVLLSGACTSVETLADVDKISLDAGKSQEEKLYKIILTSLAEKEVKLALQVNDLPEISFVMIPGRDVTILGQLAGVKAPLYSNLLYCQLAKDGNKYVTRFLYKSEVENNIFFYEGVLNEGNNIIDSHANLQIDNKQIAAKCRAAVRGICVF